VWLVPDEEQGEGDCRKSAYRIAQDVLCLRGASPGASPSDETGAATKKASEKTSKAVCALTEIA
jgi:hypothetical protein